MKHLKRFNESITGTGFSPKIQKQNDRVPVKVKDLIEYFQTLDPDMEVSLDKDGWDYYPTPLETIQNTNLFDTWEYDGKKRLTINN